MPTKHLTPKTNSSIRQLPERILPSSALKDIAREIVKTNNSVRKYKLLLPETQLSAFRVYFRVLLPETTDMRV